MGIEINRILKQFADLQHGDCWIGANFKDTFHGIDAELAAKQAIKNSNTIWQITAHIIYWRTTVANRLAGNSNPPPFRDFLLPDELNDSNWKQTLHDFEAAYHLLRNAIHNIKQENLDKLTVRPPQTYYDLIIGCLQHDAYHLGQLRLLKNNC